MRSFGVAGAMGWALRPSRALARRSERHDHLVDRGWADFKVALHVGLGRWAPEHVRIGIDEGQVLALLFGEALSAGAARGA